MVVKQKGKIVLSRFDEMSSLFLYVACGFLVEKIHANYMLLIIVQILFFLDLFVGVGISIYTKKFNSIKFWLGIKKIVSLYLALTIVAVGTLSTIELVGHDGFIGYKPEMFFNIFVFILIAYQLQSINRHLAEKNFHVNKILDGLLPKFIEFAISRFISRIDRVSPTDNPIKTDKDNKNENNK